MASSKRPRSSALGCAVPGARGWGGRTSGRRRMRVRREPRRRGGRRAGSWWRRARRFRPRPAAWRWLPLGPPSSRRRPPGSAARRARRRGSRCRQGCGCGRPARGCRLGAGGCRRVACRRARRRGVRAEGLQGHRGVGCPRPLAPDLSRRRPPILGRGRPLVGRRAFRRSRRVGGRRVGGGGSAVRGRVRGFGVRPGGRGGVRARARGRVRRRAPLCRRPRRPGRRGVPFVARGDPSGVVASGLVPGRSTYGRIRRGSKSSAAAASAVRVSRRASAARRAQAHVGVWSACLGAPHSGHGCPFGWSTCRPSPRELQRLCRSSSQSRPRAPGTRGSARTRQAITGHTDHDGG